MFQTASGQVDRVGDGSVIVWTGIHHGGGTALVYVEGASAIETRSCSIMS